MCADSLDGRPITDIERQFLKNWKVMHNHELRLMAPPAGDSAELHLMAPPGGDVAQPDDSACTAGSAQLSAGVAKVMASAPSTRQQSVLVVSARQTASEPANVEMSMVPCCSASTKQPLYYDSELPIF